MHGSGPRWSRRAEILVLLVVLAPFVVAAICLVTGARFISFDDIALIELRTRDVGHVWPLVGPYSRFTWEHPGPMLFYVLALPYRLLGADTRALWLSALGVDVLAVVGTLASVRRSGPAVILTTATVLLVLLVGLGAAVAGDPWNPSVTLLPFLFFLFVAWRLMSGSGRALPVAIVVGSLVVQSHVGYALPVLMTGAAGVVGFLRVWRRTPRPRPSIRLSVALAAAAVIVVWAPPVADQLGGSGNLGGILQYFTSPGPSAGFRKGLVVAFDQFAVTPRWVRGQNTYGLFAGSIDTRSMPAPVLLVPFAAAVGYAWYRRWTDLVRLAVVAVIALVGAVIAVAEIRGPVAPYLVEWTAAVAALAMIVTVAAPARALCGTRASRTVTVALVAAMTAASVWAAVGVTRVLPPRVVTIRPSQASVERAVDRIVRAVDGHGPVRVDSRPFSLLVMPSVVAQLEERGIATTVPARLRRWFGESRADPRGERVSVVIAASPEEALRLRVAGLRSLGVLRQQHLYSEVFLRSS